jgi:hypothetical protein
MAVRLSAARSGDACLAAPHRAGHWRKRCSRPEPKSSQRWRFCSSLPAGAPPSRRKASPGRLSVGGPRDAWRLGVVPGFQMWDGMSRAWDAARTEAATPRVGGRARPPRGQTSPGAQRSQIGPRRPIGQASCPRPMNREARPLLADPKATPEPAPRSGSSPDRRAGMMARRPALLQRLLCQGLPMSERRPRPEPCPMPWRHPAT